MRFGGVRLVIFRAVLPLVRLAVRLFRMASNGTSKQRLIEAIFALPVAALVGLASGSATPPDVRSLCEIELGRRMLAQARADRPLSERLALALPEIVEALSAGFSPSEIAFCLGFACADVRKVIARAGVSPVEPN